MTTDEMIAQIASLLGKIGTVIDSEILLELKLAQIKAERSPELPWFLEVEKETTMTIGEPRVQLPVDFLRERERSAYYVQLTDSSLVRLVKDDLDDLRVTYPVSGTGQPKFYDIMGGYLWAYPAPDQAYTVQMHYSKRDTELALADSGNLWSTYYPDMLMGLAGQRACMAMRAFDVKPLFDEMVSLAANQIIVDNVARETTNREDSYGGG